jgi:type IX secretion system PorP/SprF family membrane protein
MVKSIIKITIILFLSLFSGVRILSAQQFSNYTLFYMSKYAINPAIAGVNGATNLSLIAREESVGFEGTPKTHAFSIDSRILGKSNIYKKIFQRNKKFGKSVSGNVGWGLSVYSDLNGPIDKTGINGTYSYHIDFKDSQLSLGISLVLFQLSIQKNGFITDDGIIINDPLLMGGNESLWITDANFGIYYSSAEYYCGYSTIQLFNSFAQFGANGQGEYELTRQHTIIGGYKFEVNRMFELEPMTLIKVDENLRTQANLGFRVIYDKRFWGGINYRTMNTLSFHCGLNINKYYVGYAFDYGINSMGRQTLGTHELIVSISLGHKNRYKWLNTF